MTSKSNEISVSHASGTPGTLAKLPTHADLMANPNLDPIHSSCEAHKWLDHKEWVLSEEQYDQSKIVHILLATQPSPKS